MINAEKAREALTKAEAMGHQLYCTTCDADSMTTLPDSIPQTTKLLADLMTAAAEMVRQISRQTDQVKEFCHEVLQDSNPAKVTTENVNQALRAAMELIQSKAPADMNEELRAEAAVMLGKACKEDIKASKYLDTLKRCQANFLKAAAERAMASAGPEVPLDPDTFFDPPL